MERSLTCTYVTAAGFLTAVTDPRLYGETGLWRREKTIIQEALFRPTDLKLQGALKLEVNRVFFETLLKMVAIGYHFV